MKKNITKLEEAVLQAGKNTQSFPEPDVRWKMDLMRQIRLAQPRKEPVSGLGPVAWKWAGAALTATLVLSMISSRYGALEDYLALESEISQTADYMLARSL